MKKKIFIFSASLLISSLSIAQKKELRDAEKALKNGSITEAKSALQSLDGSISSADDKYKAQYYFLEGKVNYEEAKKGGNTDAAYQKAVEAFKQLIAVEKESGREKYTGEASQLIQTISADLVNAAVEDNKNKDYAVAAKKLYMAYQLDTNNQDYLYFAASSAVNGEDFDTALEYYKELKDLGYTGETTRYFATNKESGEREELPKDQRDLMVKAGTYKDPEEEKTESRLPEIVKNIAYIYNQKGDSQKAIDAVKEARKIDPEDLNLLMTEANLYIKLDQKDKFKEIMEQAIQKDPNNPMLYYNLGVITAEQGDKEQAKKYYEKAIELDPKNEASYMNMASLVLGEEVAIVDEMNSLGTSQADNKRYDVLKDKREGLYKKAIPYLEKILELNPKSVEATKTLMNIYGSIGENAKYEEMKAKLGSMEQ
ncbi:tetratricopeptide repeat protein [Sinomicrobium weinanense]|uniref:Tetratricopeptide repeat protein n=1 Tax=Sinomicrobium weinanense TaxID=2842200 RepID=A0A926JWC5_9FLAO|nr:tetratricopeptide repeat protein [Sinomicrobium weinanense]MBC9798539.1 tetratricopeptide repeat protein [Sinomicrobium weinanense]MBU3122580.1 tetratricopeptide repeat protein [Sinomicrobium weinanense]